MGLSLSVIHLPLSIIGLSLSGIHLPLSFMGLSSSGMHLLLFSMGFHRLSCSCYCLPWAFIVCHAPVIVFHGLSSSVMQLFLSSMGLSLSAMDMLMACPEPVMVCHSVNLSSQSCFGKKNCSSWFKIQNNISHKLEAMCLSLVVSISVSVSHCINNY